MATATATRTRRTRAGAEGGLPVRLILSIRSTFYDVHRLNCDPGYASKAYRLSKADGTRYDVARTRHGVVCDCPDFVYRRDGLDPEGCKHVRALIAQGLLDDGSATAVDPAAGRN